MYVITGGSSGIGKALAVALAAREQSVLIVGRRKNLLEAVASLSPFIDFIAADIATSAGREAVLDKIYPVKQLKALINNAGILEPLIAMQDIDPAAFSQIMATNVEAPLFLTQLLMPFLAEGRVLNIGSGAAHVPLHGMGAYCISKAALHMLTHCYQVESKQVNFACVMPGIIDTDMQMLLRKAESLDREHQDFYNAMQRDNKLISQKTVAAFLCWLLLDISKEEYSSKEWDIYDTTHHGSWLKPPLVVPQWDKT